MPGVEVVWTRDSTGVITARFLAEKDNPRADMVLGHAATALLLFEKMGLLETYKPAGVDALKAAFRDSTAPYTWTGMDAYLGVICFNTAEAGKANIKAPTSWKDLHQARIQGQAGDAASGFVRHRLSDGRRLAADDGRSGSLEVHGRAAREHRRLYPFRFGALRAGGQGRARRRHRARHARRFGKDQGRAARSDHSEGRHRLGNGSRSASSRAPRTSKLAKKIADWAATKGANELYSKTYAVVAMPGVENYPPNYPADAEKG